MDTKASALPANYTPGPGKFDPNDTAYEVQSKEMIRRVKASIEHYGLPLGVQWYTWHKARFDGDYPDYFPARPGFVEALKSLARPGLYQHGFINGLWYDRSLPSFRSAAPHAIRTLDVEEKRQPNANPDPLIENKGQAYMCPATSYWQKSLADIARQMAGIGFQGAYLDVTANAGGILCFETGHGHPPGGGNWFPAATRKLVDGMKGEGKLLYITSECFNETLGQSVDLFYTWNDWRPQAAPLLGAIYGGYLQWYGSDNIANNATKITRGVFWGGRVCLHANWDFQSGRENFRDFLVHLTQIQRRGVKYLTYGTMLRPPDWGAGQQPDNLERAAWQASDGTVALFLMNYVPRPQKAILNLGSMRGLTIERDPQVVQPAGTAPVTVKVEGDRLNVDIPAAFPLMIVIGSKKSP
jgi:hypothetical protein